MHGHWSSFIHLLCRKQGNNLVDEANNKSRCLALVHTCGKWAVQLRALDCGRNLRERSHLLPRVTTCFLTFPPKLKTTRNKIVIQLYTLFALIWISESKFQLTSQEKHFFLFLLRQTCHLLPYLCCGRIETVYGKQLHNIHDAWRFDASAVTDMTQIASGSFSDETSCISIICRAIVLLMFSVRYILHASEVEYFHKRHIFILTSELVFIGSNDTL